MLRLASCSLSVLSRSLPGIAQKVFNPKPLIQQCMNFSGINRLGLPLLPPKTSIVSHVCGFKVKARLKKRCKDCYFVVREERLYVICKTHPRHKQMMTKEKPHNTWILTHASQSPIRPW